MHYDLDELYADLRSMIGDPPEARVTRRTLRRSLQRAVDWVASQCEYKRTDTTTFALVADQYEYTLPTDVLQVQEVMWDGKQLDFASIEEWRRDRLEWRTATSSNPTEVAVDGRQLFLYPPPSAAAVSADANLTLRYMAATFELTDTGVPGFGADAMQLVVYVAAREYMALNNMDGRFNIQSVTDFIAERLTDLKERAARQLADYQPATRPPQRMTASR